MWIALGAVIVVLVLVLAFVFVLPSLSSSAGTSGGPLTYDQALPIASKAADATSGGPWAAFLGSGILSTVSATEMLNTSTSSDCNVTLLPGVSNNVTVPAGPANTTGGTATAWVFLYRNVDGEVLIVTVLDGKATALATIAAGQECTTIFELLDPIASNVIDSSVAAGDLAADAATFLGAHPDVVSKYVLIGGITFLGHIGAEWELNYTTCPVQASAGTLGSSFNATLNATTGTVLYTHTASGFACSTSSSVSLARDSSVALPLGRGLDSTGTARRS